MWGYFAYRRHEGSDPITDAEQAGCLGPIFGGLIVPAVFWISGIMSIINREALVGSGSRSMKVTDDQAIAAGIASLCIGLLIHVWFGWRNWRGLWMLVQPGILLGLVGFIGSFGYIIYHQLATFAR